jgi:hypothetical protein
MSVTQASVTAAIEAEGWTVMPQEVGLIEQAYHRAIGSRGWRFPDLPRSAVLAYEAPAIPLPVSHADVLVWGTISRIAYRAGEYAAARYAETMYRDLHADMVRVYAVEDGG